MNNRLCVAYSSDNNYAKFLYISLYSLLEKNKGFGEIHVAVMDSGIEPGNRARLEVLCRGYKRDIAFYPLTDVKERLRLSEESVRKISVASYSRLFLAGLVPHERVLYLDCDTIVNDSLLELWNFGLDEYLIAGVEDTVDAHFKQVIGLPPQARYVNAGLLLLNLKAWRQEGLEERFIAFIRRFEGSVPHHDQGTLNGVCHPRVGILPLRYNVTSNVYSFPVRTIRRMYGLAAYYPQQELDVALANPAIVHFTSGLLGRPWEEGCRHPDVRLFLDAKAKSPWAAESLGPNRLNPNFSY